MLTIRTKILTTVLSLAAFALTGCGAEQDDLLATCAGGKCDGTNGSFKNFYSDMRKVDLSDLLNLGAEHATKQVGRLLERIPYSDFKLSEPEVYATADRAKDDLTLHDIDDLQAGLLSRYGDTAFVSQINELRRGYLHQHPGEVYAESAFRLGIDFDPAFKFDVAGFPLKFGLDAKSGVEARLIAPYSGERSALVDAPIAAMKAVRGFALPASFRDVKKMAPGETLSLAGYGAVAGSVGIGIPIHLTTIAQVAMLHAVFSAGAHMRVEGRIDMQLVRGADDVAFVDVGVTGINSQKFKVALKTKWGIEGLLASTVSVAGRQVDLGRYAERAIERHLRKKLEVFRVQYKNEKRDVRNVLARFKFDLKGESNSQAFRLKEAAMAQAMRGDIRLAQALANRPGSGVTKVLDFNRDVESRSKYFGGHFLGLEFYRIQNHYKGNVTISEGNHSQQLLFDELEELHKNFLGPSYGYNRRSLVSIERENGRVRDAMVNLRVKLKLKDDYTERWQILGHIDHLLAFFIGPHAMQSSVSPYTDALEVFMNRYCRRYPREVGGLNVAYRRCYRGTEATQHPWAQDVRADATQAFENALARGDLQGGLDPAFDNAEQFARQLWQLKLAVQGSMEYPATLTGPESSFTIEYRLGERAIDDILLPWGREVHFAQALRDTLKTTAVDYRRDTLDWQEDRDDDLDDLEEGVASVTRRFKRFQRRYRQLQALANLNYGDGRGGTRTVGNGGQLMVLGDDNKISLESVVERKGQIAAAFFDKLVSRSEEKDLGHRPYQTAAYALLRMARPADVELLVRAKFKKDNYTDHPDLNLYGRGENARLISAGRFDLHRLARR